MLYIIQHVPFETSGSIQHWADVRSVDLTVIHPYEGQGFPAIQEGDQVVLMGGPMSVNDMEKLPWLAEELDWIKTLIAGETKMLGVCLGGQILAKGLGADISKNPEREIGWFPVVSHRERIETVLDEALPKRLPVFHWHGERFDIPDGAIPIYSSEGCEEQAFLYEDRILGMQFHLEILPDTIEELIEVCADEMTPGPFVQDVNEIRSKTGQHMRNSHHQLFSLLDQFFLPELY